MLQTLTSLIALQSIESCPPAIIFIKVFCRYRYLKVLRFVNNFKNLFSSFRIEMFYQITFRLIQTKNNFLDEQHSAFIKRPLKQKCKFKCVYLIYFVGFCILSDWFIILCVILLVNNTWVGLDLISSFSNCLIAFCCFRWFNSPAFSYNCTRFLRVVKISKLTHNESFC